MKNTIQNIVPKVKKIDCQACEAYRELHVADLCPEHEAAQTSYEEYQDREWMNHFVEGIRLENASLEAQEGN